MLGFYVSFFNKKNQIRALVCSFKTLNESDYQNFLANLIYWSLFFLFVFMFLFFENYATYNEGEKINCFFYCLITFISEWTVWSIIIQPLVTILKGLKQNISKLYFHYTNHYIYSMKYPTIWCSEDKLYSLTLIFHLILEATSSEQKCWNA